MTVGADVSAVTPSLRFFHDRPVKQEKEATASTPGRVRRMRGLVARRLEASLWILGVSCLAWTGWALTDSHLYQQAAQERLKAASSEATGGNGAREAAIDAAVGTPLATLSIPRIGLSAVVAEGTTPTVLRRAVGRLRNGVRIGEPDNLVLAGHRDRYFRDLGQLQAGDLISLHRAGITETYAVQWTRVVEPEQIEVAGRTGHPTLTLVTCYPFWYVGHAPQRFVVRAVKRTS